MGRKCDKLPFDFAIINPYTQQVLYLIEYDGIQHFAENHQWKKDGYKITHSNDLLKNKYCFDNNIPLIRIPFNKQYTIQDIKIEATSCLLTPSNEYLYYQIDKI